MSDELRSGVAKTLREECFRLQKDGQELLSALKGSGTSSDPDSGPGTGLQSDGERTSMKIEERFNAHENDFSSLVRACDRFKRSPFDRIKTSIPDKRTRKNIEEDMNELDALFKDLEKSIKEKEKGEDPKRAHKAGDDTASMLSAATTLVEREPEAKRSMWARRWGSKGEGPGRRSK